MHDMNVLFLYHQLVLLMILKQQTVKVEREGGFSKM